MTLTINQAVYEASAGQWMGWRLVEGAKAWREHEGTLAAGAKVGLVAGALFYTMAFTAVGLSGIGRTLLASAAERHVYAKMAFLGNAGSWFLQLWASGTLCEAFVRRMVRDGEYLRLVPLARRWLQQQSADLEGQRGGDDAAAIYKEVLKLLRQANEEGLWRRAEGTMRLKTLELFPGGEAPSCRAEGQPSQLVMDRAMAPLLQEIDSELRRSGWWSHLREGCCHLRLAGPSHKLKALLGGVVAPTALAASAVLDGLGVVGLARLIYGEGDDMTEEGHISEWGFNAVEALTLAYLMLLWTVVYVGVYARAYRVYDSSLSRLRESAEEHDHLRALAAKDLKAKSRDAALPRPLAIRP